MSGLSDFKKNDGLPVIAGKPRAIIYSVEGDLTIKGLSFYEVLGVIAAINGFTEGAQASSNGVTPASNGAKVTAAEQPPMGRLAAASHTEPTNSQLAAAAAKAAAPAAAPAEKAKERVSARAEDKPRTPEPKESEDRASSPTKRTAAAAKPAAAEEEENKESKWLVDLDNIPQEIIKAGGMRPLVSYFVDEYKVKDAERIYREFVRLGTEGKLPYYSKVRDPRTRIAQALDFIMNDEQQ